MKKTSIRKTLASALSIVLIAASALFVTGCSNNSTSSQETSAQTSAAVTEAATSAAQESSEAAVVGEGQTSFAFNVTDKDGKETKFEVHTDKTTVGEALLDAGLIQGEDSEYGLYVKTVNGVTADYDADGVYWAFYIDGEYASTGVDSTPITEGSVYAFKVE